MFLKCLFKIIKDGKEVWVGNCFKGLIFVFKVDIMNLFFFNLFLGYFLVF